MTRANRHFGWTDGSDAEASDAPASPCIRQCTLDERDLCVGCGRTLGEILDWSAAPAARKIEIRAAAASRLEQRRQRRL
jgi:predicted Fe-S protein YdhL (DUF1289 family)